MIYINTNVTAMSSFSSRSAAESHASLLKSTARLSTGFRINTAADDAAGLAISEGFKAQIRGLNQAVRNAYDGISLAQTTEGALQETTHNLQRIRELAVQAANGTNNSSDLAALQAEIDQRLSEIDNISANTEFNGLTLLDAANTFSFQVGADSGETLDITTAATDTSTLGVIEVDVIADAGGSISAVDTALDIVSGIRAQLGATQNRLESTIMNLQTSSENLSAANSRILDADFAAETATLTRSRIRQQASNAMLAQANLASRDVLNLLG